MSPLLVVLLVALVLALLTLVSADGVESSTGNGDPNGSFPHPDSSSSCIDLMKYKDEFPQYVRCTPGGICSVDAVCIKAKRDALA
jgi:hypothetical protein